MLHLIAAAILCAGLLFPAVSVHAQDIETNDSAITPEIEPLAEGETVPYDVRFVGRMNGDLEAALRGSSLLVSLEDKPPASVRRLEARAETDVDRLGKVLRAEGYYDGSIDFKIREQDGKTVVDVQVKTGPLYRFGPGRIDYGDAPVPEGLGWPTKLSQVGIEEGAAARAETVVAAETEVVRRLHQRGRPYAKAGKRQVIVDHDTRRMDVTFSVEPGVAARLGPARFTGAPGVEDSYLRRFVPWREGEIFDQGKLDTLSERLVATKLFATVRVTYPDAPAPDGELAINVALKERPPRSIGIGGSYSTSQGPGAHAYWEHRNIFGRGQTLRPSIEASRIEQKGTVNFKVPNFRRFDQDIISETSLYREDSDAYREVAVSETLRIERQLSNHWRVGGGGLVKYSDVVDDTGDNRYTLLGIPTFVSRDDADDLLNPTKGSRLRADFTPYHAFSRDPASFTKTQLTGAAYITPIDDFPMVIAARAKLGSIAGADTDSVPASERFYAGGGGSIRGYGYQQVGPVDSNGDPTGGRSLFEVGLETRFRVWGPIGLVTFVEAGDVYESVYPAPFQSVLVGAGFGLRYFTAVGPIRVDLAFPLDRRPGDDPFQFYVSIGQAF